MSSPGSSSSPAQRGVEALGVHAAVPPRHALGADADLAQRLVGRRAGGEHEVARPVEGPHRQRHRLCEAYLTRALRGVGGELGVVAAHQRQAERACDERARHPDRPGRADVDRVEGALGERLHGGGQARHADAQAGVEGDVHLGDRGETAVDGGVGADHLDLEARHAALADLFERARDPVGAADPVGHDRHPRRLPLARVELGLLAAQEGGGGGVGDRGDAALEDAPRRARRVDAPRLLCVGGRRDGLHDRLHGSAQLALVCAAGATVQVGVSEALVLHVRDQPALVELVEPDCGEPRAQQAPGVGGVEVCADGAVARLALTQQTLGHGEHRAGVRPLPTPGLATALGLDGAAAERVRGERDRGVRPLRGAALFAPRGGPPGAHVGEELRGAARGRGLRPGASDVHPRVVVAAADARAVERGYIGGRRAVELAGARAVAYLPDRERVREAPAVARGEGGADGVVGVGQRAHALAGAQVLRALLHIPAVRLQPLVVGGVDPVAEHVHRRPRLAAEVGGELLGDEHVGALGDLQHAGDRVVIGDRHEVHPAPLGQLVDLLRRGRALGQPHRPLHPQARDLRGRGVAVHVHPRHALVAPVSLPCDRALRVHTKRFGRKLRVLVTSRAPPCEGLVKRRRSVRAATNALGVCAGRHPLAEEPNKMALAGS